MRTACCSSHPRGGLPQYMLEYTHPWVWAWRPPWMWVWDPPGNGPGDPPRCGSGDPSGQTPQLPPWVWALRPPPTPETCKACWDITCKACWDTNQPPSRPATKHAGVPPAMHVGILPPPWTEWQTGTKLLPCPKPRLRMVNMTWAWTCLLRTKQMVPYPNVILFIF